jgi:hypothetical protein
VTTPITLPSPLQGILEAANARAIGSGRPIFHRFLATDGQGRTRIARHELHTWEAEIVRQAGAFVNRLVLESNPAVRACRRMRLPADYLYSYV